MSWYLYVFAVNIAYVSGVYWTFLYSFSIYFDIPISEKLIAFGEIGLGGEVRNTSNISQRIFEAERLGFTECIIPKHSLRNIDPHKYNMHIYGVSSLKQAFAVIKNKVE